MTCYMPRINDRAVISRDGAVDDGVLGEPVVQVVTRSDW